MHLLHHIARLSRLPRPPSRWLYAVLGYVLAAMALAIGLSLQAPWLGLQLVADGAQVRVLASQGPSAAVPAGAVLRSVRATDGGAALELQAADLLEEPDVLPSYAQMDAFFARQQHLAQVLAQPRVTLHWQVAHGSADAGPGAGPGTSAASNASAAAHTETSAGASVSTVVAPGERPLRSLPVLFWFQLAVSVTGCLIACWVWVLRPHDLGARMFGITGLAFPVFAMPAAVYSGRELALEGDLFFALSALNHGGSVVFGAALCGIFMAHPQPLVRPLHLLWLFGVSGLWWLVGLVRLVSSPAWGIQLLVMVEMLLAMGLAAVQWRRSRGDALHRASLRWFILSLLVGSGLFIVLIIATASLGWLAPLPQGYAFGFFLFIYVGIALGLRRYRLFELDEWAFRMLLWVGGALAVVAFDALLIVALDWSAASALGVSLWVCGALYFPARQWLWQRLAQRPAMQLHELMPDVVEIAFQPSRTLQRRLWQALLHRLYDPLSLEPGSAGALAQARVEEGGLALQVPACASLNAVRLRYPARGQRLFSAKDATFVDALAQLLDQTESSRDAHERGARDERRRIARDMHDDVGARLLMLIHRAQSPELTELARAAMNDLRTALNVMDAHAIALADALADWRAEASARCEAAGVVLAWTAPTHLPQHAGVPLQLGSRQKAVMERALREGLSNALRHGQPRTVDIAVALEGATLALSLRNDGVPTTPAQWAEGRGLRGMRQRLHEYGAQLQTTTLADGRTEVALRLPLQLEPEPEPEPHPPATRNPWRNAHEKHPAGR